jgi:hypothetical protein
MEFRLYGPDSRVIRTTPPLTPPPPRQCSPDDWGSTLLAFRLLSDLLSLLEGHRALRLLVFFVSDLIQSNHISISEKKIPENMFTFIRTHSITAHYFIVPDIIIWNNISTGG